MNKEEIIKILKKYNFNDKRYIVISGAAMVLYGLKEKTGDIDIAVDDDYYNFLLKEYKCTFERINEYNKKIYFIDDIINFGVTYYSENKTYISSIPVQTKEDLIKLKVNLNREKDKRDIEIIREHFNG